MLKYPKLNDKAHYESFLGGDATKLAQFNTLWNDYIRVDINDYISRFNALEGTGDVVLLTALQSEVEASFNSMKSYHGHFGDINVEKAANDMYMELSKVRSAVQSEIRIHTRVAKTSLGDKILKAKKAMGKAKHGINKVVDAYEAFSAPANDIFEGANIAINSGGGNIYEKIGNFGKRK